MEWISVNEKFPDTENSILTFCPDGQDGYKVSVSKYISGIFYAMHPDGFKIGYDEWNITHWMPLPEPPKTK